MAGTSYGPLVCKGFLETDGFKKSAQELIERTGISPRELDDRIEALQWALERNPSAEAEQIVRAKR